MPSPALLPKPASNVDDRHSHETDLVQIVRVRVFCDHEYVRQIRLLGIAQLNLNDGNRGTLGVNHARLMAAARDFDWRAYEVFRDRLFELRRVFNERESDGTQACIGAFA
jgi:hypothetical protein